MDDVMSNTQGFPTGVYKCSPSGRYPGNGGRKFDMKPATNQAELDVLLGDGWSLSLPAAEDAFDLTKPQAGPATPSNSTPEERAQAADALQADAAARLNQANEQLKIDQDEADVAEKAADRIEQEYAEATEAKAEFDARYSDFLARRTSALSAREAKRKNLASSKVRQAAADRALDDAAGKVIMSSDLLTQAKQKAIDKEIAKQKALEAAQQKEDPPATPEPPAHVEPEAAPTPPPEPVAATPTPPAPPAAPPRGTRGTR